MPTILNPYSGGDNSLGKSLLDLGNTLFGPAQLHAQLYREKAKGLIRENENLPLVADALAAGNVDTAIRHGVLSGMKGDDVANYNRLGTVSRAPSVFAPNVAQSMLAAGGAYSSTPQGFQTAQDNEMIRSRNAIERAAQTQTSIADNTPVLVVDPTDPSGLRTRTVSRAEAIRTGVPMVPTATQAEGLGRLDVLQRGVAGRSPEQLRAAGALPPADRLFNWQDLDPNTGAVVQGRTSDGRTDMATGQPLPATARLVSPGNAGGAMGPMAPDATQSRDIRGKVLSNTDLVNLVDMMEKRITADPTIVGLPGQTQRLTQNAVGMAQDVLAYVGKGQNSIEGANNIRQEAVQRYGAGIANLIPELFKPGISELEALHGLAVYKTAEALAGQSGRDLSDRDVAGARAMVGDPTSWFTSAQEVLSKMRIIRDLGKNNIARYSQMLNQQSIQPRGLTPPAASGSAPNRPAVDWQEYFSTAPQPGFQE